MIEERKEISGRVFALLLALLLAASAAVGLNTAFAPRALETHEIFVAQTSREMIANGNYIVPRFAGEIRLKKPPLMYWAVVWLAKVVDRPDIPEWVARVPSALSAVLMVAACVAMGVWAFDRRTGLLAGAMLAFSPGVIIYAGNARPEMMYAACTAVGLAGFTRALRDPPHSLRYAMLGWFGFGLALLAKGPQLPALAMLGLSGYTIVTRGWRGWAEAIHPVRGVGLMLLVAVPWAASVLSSVKGAGAIWENELIHLRFGGADDPTGNSPGFVGWLLEVLKPKYLAHCVWMLLPWGVLALGAALSVWRRSRPHFHTVRDLFFALLVAVIGLSLAFRSHGYYLLPGLPILAVLLAREALDILDRARNGRYPRLVMAGLMFVVGAGLTVGIGVRAVDGVNGRDALAIGGTIVAAAALGLAVIRTLRPDQFGRGLIWGITASALACGLAGQAQVFQSERRQRSDDVARQAAESSKPAMPVLSINFDPNDLIYRVGRPIQGREESVSAAELKSVGEFVLVAPPSVVDRLVSEGLVIERRPPIELRRNSLFEVATVRGDR